MKKPLLATIVLLCLFGVTSAQFVSSLHTNGGGAQTTIRDAQGNVYSGVYLYGDTLGGVVHPNANSSGYGIAKFDAFGQVVWSSMAEYATTGIYIDAMDVDANGNVVFVAEFDDTVRWNGFQDVTAVVTGSYWEFVVGMIDSVGTLQWLHGFDNWQWWMGSIEFLSNGNIAMVSGVRGPSTFNGYSFPASDSIEGYLLVMDRMATVQNAYHLDGIGHATFVDVTEGPQGDLWALGQFQGGSATFQGTTITGLGIPGGSTQFFAKLDQAGNLDWIAQFDSSQGFTNELEVDGQGNCYFASSFFNHATLGGVTVSNGNVNGTDFLAGKLDVNGNCQWLVPSYGNCYNCWMSKVDYHPSGRVLFGGWNQQGGGTFAGMPFFDASHGRNFYAVLDTNGVALGSILLDSTLTTFFSGQLVDTATAFFAGNYYGTANLLGYPLPGHGSGYDFFWAEVSLHSNQIRGFHYADIDQNGSYGPGDFAVPATPISTTNGMAGLTDPNGEFLFFVGPGPYSVSSAPAGPMYTIQPTAHTGTFAATGDIDSTAVFRSIPNSIIPDLRLDLLGSQRAQPGMVDQMYLLQSNWGSQAAGGTVSIDLDPRTTYTSAQPVPDTVSGQHLAWIGGAITPFTHQSIALAVTVDTTVVIGDTLLHTAKFLSTQADYNLLNQSDTSVVEVVTSFDPNDKSVNPSVATPAIANSGAKLQYLIRFQNTGTGTAFRVIVKDTLSPLLDASTFRLIGTSHPGIVTAKAGNVITWIFNPISLPDSGTNLLESQGFIAFEIAPQIGLVNGDSITNRAGIYFDYNVPVITEPAIFHVSDGSATTVPPTHGNSMVRLFPNPGTAGFGLSGLETKAFPISITVVNLDGNTVLERAGVSREASGFIPVGSIGAGLHLVRVVTATGETLVFKWTRE